MNLNERMAALVCLGRQGSFLGLERIESLMRLLGDPHKGMRFIHVAGSNGKGSVCAMLSSILTRAGYRTGMYISPHLASYRERMQIDGTDISEEALCGLIDEVRPVVEHMEDRPTEFEIITAMALLYFRRMHCEAVVLEVGLGGRLDATNIIPVPEAAVLMNIGLEHTDILGGTLERIAFEKAGIIKAGGAAVVYPSAPEADAVFEAVCKERQAGLRKARFGDIAFINETLDGQRFHWRGYSDLEITLLGRHQLRNAVMALETVETLRERGFMLPEAAVREGLFAARWPARLEVLCREPLFILDGAHNPQCAEALADSVRALCPGRRVIFLTGVLADKDYRRIIECITPLASAVLCLTVQSDRALPADALAECLRERGITASVCANTPDGISSALAAAGKEGAVVAFGSLYLAGEIREAFPHALSKWLNNTVGR